jgi:hypothetical protein
MTHGCLIRVERMGMKEEKTKNSERGKVKKGSGNPYSSGHG